MNGRCNKHSHGRGDVDDAPGASVTPDGDAPGACVTPDGDAPGACVTPDGAAATSSHQQRPT